jgi:hypothetical protein
VGTQALVTAQRFVVETQIRLQQSELLEQMSPPLRQKLWNEQAPPRQVSPQHWLVLLHVSPRGWQVLVPTQRPPPEQALLQHWAFEEHALLSVLQIPAVLQVKVVGLQNSEQHSDAAVQP